MSIAEKLSKAISLLQINSVYLHASNVKLGTHPTLFLPEHVAINIEESAEWKLNKTGDLLLCHVHRLLTGNDEQSDSDKAHLTIEVSFVVQYLLDDPERTIDDHTFKVFCETNALYNSYPYFREFVHSTCTRMGIHPILLPFLKPLTMKEITQRFPETPADSPEVKPLQTSG